MPIDDAMIEEALRLDAEATAGPWEVGGPYPGASVVVETSRAIGWPEPAPAEHEAIAILDSRTSGEPDPVAGANRDLIAAYRTLCPAFAREVRRVREGLETLSAWLRRGSGHNKADVFAYRTCADAIDRLLSPPPAGEVANG